MKADYPSDAAFVDAAAQLQCETATIRAFAKVEAGPAGAFLDSGAPVILFERHYFYRLTNGRYAGAIVPGYASESWSRICDDTPGQFGPTSKQHLRLEAAAALDRTAALKSASWGLFQIMGSNHGVCGYPALQDFINAMYRSADDHLHAFVGFIRANKQLAHALRTRDWATAARLYNGRLYAKNRYDVKLAAAYEHFQKARTTT